MIISETLSKINLNSTRIAKLLKSINDEISEVSSAVCQLNREKNVSRISLLQAENQELEKQVEKYKQELIRLRIVNGVPHVAISSSPANKVTSKASEPVETPAKSNKEENVVVAPKNEKAAKSIARNKQSTK